MHAGVRRANRDLHHKTPHPRCRLGSFALCVGRGGASPLFRLFFEKTFPFFFFCGDPIARSFGLSNERSRSYGEDLRASAKLCFSLFGQKGICDILEFWEEEESERDTRQKEVTLTECRTLPFALRKPSRRRSASLPLIDTDSAVSSHRRSVGSFNRPRPAVFFLALV